jgi:hypothetical protein
VGRFGLEGPADEGQTPLFWLGLAESRAKKTTFPPIACVDFTLV